MPVARIWQALGLPPRRVRTFGLSGDAAFEEKLTGVVGLYLSPPDMALGLCGNEKNVRFMQPR